MPFRSPVSDKALVAAGRHCCICHKFCGLKIELHHIKQEKDGGKNTFDNCMPVCFDCHADMRGYDVKHPKGRKYTEAELRGHRDAWYAKVAANVATPVLPEHADVDRKTFATLRAQMPWSGIVSYLKERGVSPSINSNIIAPLDGFYWQSQDPANEFLDADLEGMRGNLLDAVSELLDAISTETMPHDRNPDLGVVPAAMKSLNHDGYVKSVQRLSTAGTALVDAYDTLVRTGRRKLGVA
jgi:hypothetical protein